MRIPPYYRRPAWQRFFAGMAIGGILSWVIFMYIYGVWQEEQRILIRRQYETIEKLEREKKIWQEDYKALNEEKTEQLTIQEIKVKIVNWDKYKLDLLSAFEVEEAVKKDIDTVLKKDLQTVYKSRELIKKTIENERVKINDKSYRLEVKEIVIYTTLSIELDIHFDE